MTIREAFDTINPTIEQKNRIYERLSQNAYAQSGIKQQMIRYVSAAAALVAVTGAAAAGAVFALYNNNGSPINVSLEGSNAPETPYYTAQTTLVSTSSDSSRETPSTTPGETVPPTSVTTAETKSQPETTSEPETLPKPDINDIKAAIITDKTFWSQFGSISYDDKTISLSDDFDTLKLCTDESIGQEIINRVNSQWAFNGKVNFTSGYEAIKGGKELYNATDEEIEEYIKENAVEGKYLEVNPDFFGFSDMKGFYEKASELYTGYDYGNFKDFIPKVYAECDGKLCLYAAFGEKGSIGIRIGQAQYLLFYDSDDSIMAVAAVPDIDESGDVCYYLCAFRFVNTDEGLRCKVTSTIAEYGLYDGFSCSQD